LSNVDVYIDDFIGLAHATQSQSTLRCLLHNLDSVFRRARHPFDKLTRKQIVSASKLDTGDGAWSTQKIILGWAIDTATKTLALPLSKAECLRDILASFLTKKRTSQKQWQRLLGELRHMATAIPGAKYLFSILQNTLVDQPKSTRLRITPLVQASLHNWIALGASLHTHPMHITTLEPRAPTHIRSRCLRRGHWGHLAVNYSQPYIYNSLPASFSK
jgi:hypothetical protein